MSYKPDEVTLVNYMFDELSEEERNKVEEYLQQNPEAATEMSGLSNTRKIVSAYEDKEVIPPVNLITKTGETEAKSVGPYWRTVLAIAASFSLLILVGYLTGFQASYGEKGFLIGFNNAREKNIENITVDQIEALLNKAMEQNLIKQQDELTAFRQELQESYAAVLEEQKNDFSATMKSGLKVSKAELEQYAKSLEVRNEELVNQYFTNSGLEQQAYVKNLLVDFTGYLEEQRVQDRDFYLNRLIDLKLSSDLQQHETEQLLTTIMKSVNNLPNEETTQNF